MVDKNERDKEKEKDKLAKMEQLNGKEQDLIEMGKFYFLSQKYDEAIEEFQKTVKLNPKNPEIYYNLGVVYEAKNMKQEAKEMYFKTLEIKKNHKLAQEQLDKLVGT